MTHQGHINKSRPGQIRADPGDKHGPCSWAAFFVKGRSFQGGGIMYWWEFNTRQDELFLYLVNISETVGVQVDIYLSMACVRWSKEVLSQRGV